MSAEITDTSESMSGSLLSAASARIHTMSTIAKLFTVVFVLFLVLQATDIFTRIMRRRKEVQLREAAMRQTTIPNVVVKPTKSTKRSASSADRHLPSRDARVSISLSARPDEEKSNKSKSKSAKRALVFEKSAKNVNSKSGSRSEEKKKNVTKFIDKSQKQKKPAAPCQSQSTAELLASPTVSSSKELSKEEELHPAGTGPIPSTHPVVVAPIDASSDSKNHAEPSTKNDATGNKVGSSSGEDKASPTTKPAETPTPTAGVETTQKTTVSSPQNSTANNAFKSPIANNAAPADAAAKDSSLATDDKSPLETLTHSTAAPGILLAPPPPPSEINLNRPDPDMPRGPLAPDLPLPFAPSGPGFDPSSQNQPEDRNPFGPNRGMIFSNHPEQRPNPKGDPYQPGGGLGGGAVDN